MEIYPSSHFGGFLFLLIYAILTVIVISGLWAVLVELPNKYRRFLADFHIYPELLMSMQPQVRSTKLTTFELLLFNLIPRPKDFIYKVSAFIFGVLAALLMFQWHPNRLKVMAALFDNMPRWAAGQNAIWGTVLLVAVFLVIEELLLQQAKLLWDDIRDQKRDETIPHNSWRAISSGAMSRGNALLQLGVRLILALIFGTMAGGGVVMTVFIVILFHQAVYVLWAKPRASIKPQWLHLLLAISFPLRFLAGVVVVLDGDWLYLPVLLLFAALYFHSLGSLAAQWKMEAIDGRVKRGQGPFFLEHGQTWQALGFIAASIIAALVVSMQLLAISCSKVPLPIANGVLAIVNNVYATCQPSSGAIRYIHLGLLGAVGWTMAICLAALLIAAAVVKFIDLRSEFLRKRIKNNKSWLGIIVTAVTILSFISAILLRDPLPFFVFMFLFNLGVFISFEGMTYDEFALLNAKTQIARYLRGIYLFLFTSHKDKVNA